MAKYRPTPLGVYIEAFLFKHKMTQCEFANKIGVSPSYISQTIRGKGNAHRKVVACACINFPDEFPSDWVRTLEYRSRTSVAFNTRHMKSERRDALIEKVKDAIV